MDEKPRILKELQVIPGIGKSLSRDLYALGIRRVADLALKDPEKLYQQICDESGVRVDPCVLYTFRCAIYYARTPASRRDPELLKWWNWKERKL